MKTLKSLFAVMLALAVCLLAMPMQVSAETVVESGKCGANVTYKITSDGNMTISGSGMMYGYNSDWPDSQDNLPPWYDKGNRWNITKVHVNGSVTAIGKNAFRDCTGLNHVYLADSVTAIGDYAFFNCAADGGYLNLHFRGSRPIMSADALYYCNVRAYYYPSQSGWPGTLTYGAQSVQWLEEPLSPSITESPQDLTVGTGKKAVFSCSIKKWYPETTVSWRYMKPGDTTWTIKNFASGSATHSFTLTESADMSFDGTKVYALVSNSAGTAVTSTAYLTVGAAVPPEVYNLPTDLSVPEGDSFNITATFGNSDATSKTIWYYRTSKNSVWEKMSESSISHEVLGVPKDGVSILKIHYAAPSMDGYQFRMTATNYAGNGTSSFMTLHVLSPQEIPSVSVGITAPSVGAKPDYTPDLPSGAPYYSEISSQTYTTIMNGVSWFDETAERWVETTDVFLPGHVYYFRCDLFSKSGYAFTQDTAASVNGKGADAEIREAGEEEPVYLRVSCTFPALPNVPAAPVIAVENALTGVRVSWAKPAGGYKYAVFRKGPGETSFTKIGTTSSLSYTDTTVKNNTEYRYTVKSVNTAGKASDYAAGQSIKYLQAPTIKAENALDGVKITWNKITGASKYYIYRKGPGETGFTLLASTANLTFTNKGVVSGNDYRYSVRAYPATGKMSAFSVGYTVSYLKAPTITVQNTTEGVVISWAKITGASKYYVYRKGPGESGFTKIAGSVGLKLTDKTAVSGKEYRYSVRSVNSDATALSAYSAGQSIVRKKP